MCAADLSRRPTAVDALATGGGSLPSRLSSAGALLSLLKSDFDDPGALALYDGMMSRLEWHPNPDLRLG